MMGAWDPWQDNEENDDHALYVLIDAENYPVLICTAACL